MSYFTVNAIVGELDFPSSEIFYFQQQQFTFPVDTSMNVEIVENRKALTTVRNKKKELKDLDNHAYQAGSETSSNVVDALDSVDELETDLDQTKESMYKLSYVVRVSAAQMHTTMWAQTLHGTTACRTTMCCWHRHPLMRCIRIICVP